MTMELVGYDGIIVIFASFHISSGTFSKSHGSNLKVCSVLIDVHKMHQLSDFMKIHSALLELYSCRQTDEAYLTGTLQDYRCA
jgi:hypothetical protein